MKSWNCLAGGILIVQHLSHLPQTRRSKALETWSSYDLCETNESKEESERASEQVRVREGERERERGWESERERKYSHPVK
jgi:hypothetical protein